MQTEEILEKLKEYKAERGDAYGIETLGLFGSCARGEQLPDSDIDVCVKMKTPSFFSMAGIQNELEEQRCSVCLKISCLICWIISGIRLSLLLKRLKT